MLLGSLRANKIFSLRTELRDLTDKIAAEEKNLAKLKERKATVEKSLKYHVISFSCC